MKTKCKIWKGNTFKPSGYGRIYIYGDDKYAHRFVWEAKHGKILKGLCIIHSCDNPPCVNLKHLSIGTYKENSRDRDIKGRGAGAKNFGDRSGENQGGSKLNKNKILIIRNSKIDARILAKKFKVHFTTIYRARRGVTWGTL